MGWGEVWCGVAWCGVVRTAKISPDNGQNMCFCYILPTLEIMKLYRQACGVGYVVRNNQKPAITCIFFSCLPSLKMLALYQSQALPKRWLALPPPPPLFASLPAPCPHALRSCRWQPAQTCSCLTSTLSAATVTTATAGQELALPVAPTPTLTVTVLVTVAMAIAIAAAVAGLLTGENPRRSSRGGRATTSSPDASTARSAPSSRPLASSSSASRSTMTRPCSARPGRTSEDSGEWWRCWRWGS